MLKAAGVSRVFVTFGSGCDTRSLRQRADIPVSTDSLVHFIEENEEAGILQLGENDLDIDVGIAKVTFHFCHERDIHCRGEEIPLLLRIRKRWAHQYPGSYLRRGGGDWKRLFRGRS